MLAGRHPRCRSGLGPVGLPCPLAQKNSELSGRGSVVTRVALGDALPYPALVKYLPPFSPPPPPSYCNPCHVSERRALRYKNRAEPGETRNASPPAALSRERKSFIPAPPRARARVFRIYMVSYIWWCRVCRAVRRAPCAAPPRPAESASRPVPSGKQFRRETHTATCHTVSQSANMYEHNTSVKRTVVRNAGYIMQRASVCEVTHGECQEVSAGAPGVPGVPGVPGQG